MPEKAILKPHAQFLRFHREHVFKGWGLKMLSADEYLNRSQKMILNLSALLGHRLRPSRRRMMDSEIKANATTSILTEAVDHAMAK